MSSAAIGDRYAQAIFELGKESDQLSALCDGIRDFAEVYQSSDELRGTLSNPLIPAAQLRQVISAVAARVGVPELGIKALSVMLLRRRLAAVSEVALKLSQLRDQHEGILRAHLTTAVAMPAPYYEAFSARLQQATKRRIILETEVDPELVAGAIARVEGAVLDASVRGRLRKFEHEVIRAISAGLV